MIEDNIETENTNSAILYDLTSYTKWTSEINLNKEQNVYVKYQKNQINNYNFIFKFGSWIKNRLKLRNNENNFKFIFNSSKPWNQWKLCVSKSENYIAVLQENLIEVYTDFKNLIWQTEINTQFVKICNLFLNERHDMLCFSDEYGNIIIYDHSTGRQLFKYDETDSIEFENAICKAFFIEADTPTLKNRENDVIDLMITVTYSGFYNVFTINSNKTITKIYTQSLLNIVPNGIYCAEIDEKNQYLIIGSNAITSSKVNSNGVFIWRVLNGEPWLKHVPILEEHIRNKSPNKYLAKVNFTKIEYVTKLEIAPNNLAVAAIYISGKIAIYSLPSLKLINEWFMTEQPCYNEINSDIVENPYELKMFKQIYSEPDFRVSDIGWWSTKVLILTRGTGLLSLVSSEDLANLMGRNQQWLSPFPLLYPYQKNGFIILDCVCTLVSQADTDTERDTSLINESSTSSELNNFTDDDDADEDDDSWYTYLKEIVKSQMYNLSGFDRFKALPKRPKFLKRKFSLLHFKSTTPEELFKRKLASEEYGEALQLAKTYKLDTDLVYQKQWRSKPISKSTIIDYLSKIKKRSWVLHECLTRVSSSLDATKYLIDFGLRGTDLDSLIAIKEDDDNRFVYSQKQEFSDEFDDSNLDMFNPEYFQRKKQRLEQIRQEKLSKINLNNLTLMQKQLCQVRLKLLKYLDRLNVYELILGGPIKAAELFDPEKFQQIRSKSILEFTIDYAREGNSDAVEILFSYFDNELKNKQLEVLSNFPETLYPEDTYAKLLPAIESNQVKIFNYPENIRNEKDWIESSEFEFILNSNESDPNNSDKLNDNLVYTVNTIETWYLNRTLEIENFSGIVDVALSFAKVALANGCLNMSGIIENLQTLFTLVYECKSSSSSSQTYYTLGYVSSLNELEKLSLIMSHSYETSTELYTKNLQEWLVPFVSRRQTVAMRESLLRDYFLKISRDDLNACLKLLNLKFKTNTLFSDLNLISIFIECLYVNEKADQIEICNQIIHEISAKTAIDLPAGNLQTKSPQQTNKTRISYDLQEKIKTAQLHLKACDLFKKYGVNKTLAYIRDSCLSIENCRDALVKLTWFASKRASHLKPNEWIDLMKDLQYLQAYIYKSLISYQECTEIFLTSLLGSRNLENIKLASDWLRDILIVDKEGAVNLAVKAAQEYFNASSNYLDPDMDFAKACLNLVKTLLIESKSVSSGKKQIIDLTDYKSILNDIAKDDPNVNSCIQVIESESDLISAMKIIAEFDYNILPVQVRISTSRIDIIKDILKTKLQAYKEYDKLLYLASLLRINNENTKEQKQVMLLIAEHSLIQENLQVVTQMCNSLVRLNYSSAWSCVYKLAFYLSKNIADQFKINYESIDYQLDIQENDFLLSNKNKISIFKSIRNHDFTSQMNTLFSNKTKQIRSLSEIEKLLSFALTHCDSHLIEYILSQKNEIEIARVKLEQTEHLAVKTSTQTEIKIDSLHKDYFCNENSIDFEFDSFKKTNESVNQIVSSLLENKRLNIAMSKRNLIDNIGDLIKLDANLALGFLLEINDDNETNANLIENLFKYETSISYEFVLYLFSLNILNDLISKEINYLDFNMNDKSFLYYLKPSNLIQLFDDVDNLDVNTNSFKSFKRINKRFTEYKQNKALKELNAGIDLKRFELDDNYKKDTILGLSMDMKTFELACSLAKFYNFDLWKVYMTYTEYLFEINSNEISLNELEDKIRPLLGLLISRKNEFYEVMLKNVLNLIDGKDLDKLSVFYELLNDENSEFHIKTIKKIKSLSFEEFDYKSLLENPLETIEIYLDDTNQQFFAKLLPKMPTANEKNLTSSKIYVVWCTKKAWSLVDEIFDKNEPEIEWKIENINYFCDKFDNLNENLKKLDLETDFIYFVKELLLSQKSCFKLNIQLRKNLIKKLIKLFKQLYQQQTHKDKLNDEKFDKSNNVLLKIQNYLKTIESIHKLFDQTEIVKKEIYFQKLDYNLSHYLIESETTTSENETRLAKLEDTLIDMLFSDFEIDLVSNVISLADLKQTNIKSLIKSALNKICSLLKEAKDEMRKAQHFDKLKILLDNISSNLDKNESENDVQQQNENKTNKKKKGQQQTESNNLLELNKQKRIVNEDVMDCMRVFCNDQQVDLDLRLLILEELKKSIKNMKDEDLMLLLVYKTNAILNNCNKFANKTDLVNSLSIQTESQRLELINNYIDMSEAQEHYVAVINLLKIWPSFTDLEKKPLNSVLIKMLLNKIQFVENIKDLNKHNLITDSDINYIREELEKNAIWDLKDGTLKIAYLKLCLAAKSKKLVRNFVDTIKLECFELNEIIKLNDSDDEIKCESMEILIQDKELMNLLIEDHFYCQIMNTPLYSLFTYYILRNETKQTIHDLVRYLKQKENFTTEAAKLLLDVDRYHNPYKTLSVSLTLLNRFN